MARMKAAMKFHLVGSSKNRRELDKGKTYRAQDARHISQMGEWPSTEQRSHWLVQQVFRGALVWLLAGCCVALPVRAEIYKHVDASGVVSYTDYPVAGAKVLHIGNGGASWKPAHKGHRRPSGVSAINIPRIDAATQSQRDSLRHSVLESERATEEQSLSKARAELGSGEVLRPGEHRDSPVYLDRVHKLEEAVRLHQDNVEALGRELSHRP